MPTLTIRRLDDKVYARLQAQARANNRSMEAEVRVIIEGGLPEPYDVVERLRAFHDEMKAKHGLLPDSTQMIREMRESE